jgi:hypothetical protein
MLMNAWRFDKVLGRSTSFLVALILGVSALFTNISAAELQGKEVPPAIAVAREVNWNENTSASVRTSAEFLTAYRSQNISRIELLNDIDISNNQMAIRDAKLSRSLQIDGNGFTLRATNAWFNITSNGTDASVIWLDTLTRGQQATVHLKDLNVMARGTSFVDNGLWLYPRSEGWQLIVDGVRFARYDDQTEARRVARVGRGHVFLRNTVYMQTSAENFYAGQITVEPNAQVYGEINYEDYSTWWFSEPNQGITSIDRTLNIGENAHVELIGKSRSGIGGTTYPSIYEHWREIHVQKGATLKAAKPGNAFAFHNTAGVSQKKINVYEGATFEGTSTGTGAQPIMEEKGNAIQSHFYAAPGSTVKLIGQSNNAINALVMLRNRGSSFELERPALYDLRNNRAGAGSKAVIVGPGAQFKITNSDIEVWDGSRQGKDFSGPPSAGWYRSTVIADNNGRAVAGTHDPYNTSPDIMSTWRTLNYSRMTGVNGNPELAFEELTDADKTYVVNTTVLGVPAWWAEQVSVHVTNDKDETVQDGKNAVDGKYRYTLPDDAFFTAGTTYTATGYRGVPEWPASNTATVTVRDVTPPKPVKINEPLYHTSNNVYGSEGEAGATLSATLNGEPLNLAPNLTVKNDGTWSFDIPDDVVLNSGDVIQVFLTDTAGNTTPATKTPFRDAIFEAATKITVAEDVVPPVLHVKTPVIYDKDSTVTEAQFITDAEVMADKPLARIETNFTSVVDLHTVGAYVVDVTAYDRAGKSDTKSTVVLVKDNDTVIDLENNTMLRAGDFTLKLSEVQAADFVASAKAQAWNIVDGQPVAVKLESVKPTTGGAHDTVFSAGITTKTVKATITDDIDPELTADARIIYDVATTKDEAGFLADIHATLNEAGTITSNFKDVVDMNKVGAYVVTVQGTDTAGNKSNIVKTIVLVKDISTIIDEANNTMITAYDFALNLTEVPAADFVASAKAQAWNIVDGQPVAVKLESAKPTTGGVHDATYSAGITTKTIKATITDDIDPELTADARIIYDAGSSKDEAGFLADIHATLNEAGTITSNFKDVVDMNKVGAYVVTSQGTDTAGNKSNTVQTIVLVKDANTVIDEANNTMMTAYDFSMNLTEVPAADFVASAKAHGTSQMGIQLL